MVENTAPPQPYKTMIKLHIRNYGVPDNGPGDFQGFCIGEEYQVRTEDGELIITASNAPCECDAASAVKYLVEYLADKGAIEVIK